MELDDFVELLRKYQGKGSRRVYLARGQKVRTVALDANGDILLSGFYK